MAQMCNLSAMWPPGHPLGCLLFDHRADCASDHRRPLGIENVNDHRRLAGIDELLCSVALSLRNPSSQLVSIPLLRALTWL
jgi:hypothetical protein